MTRDDWFAVLLRISPNEPFDLDARIFGVGAVGAGVRSRDLPDDGRLGDDPSGPPLPPSARLWQLRDPDAAHIGIRVTHPLPDIAQTVLRLASVALERGVNPVILTTLDDSGFERFGLRVERLPAGCAIRQRQVEEELTSFWSLSIIIDADDIAMLG